MIGYLAGLSGIGGGIFLAPILHFLRWSTAKGIAVAASVFIAANSVAGLLSHLARPDTVFADPALYPYAVLVPAVLAGGFLGNQLGMQILPARWMKGATAVLIAYVGIRLLRKTLPALLG